MHTIDNNESDYGNVYVADEAEVKAMVEISEKNINPFKQRANTN
jgi:hypothetical protein